MRPGLQLASVKSRSPVSEALTHDRTFETNRHLSIRCDRLVLCETRLNLNKTLRNAVGSVGKERSKEGDPLRFAPPVAREKVVKGDRTFIYRTP
ncbi:MULTISPECIES: hypothetical protein [unclassified Microcoleus]